MKLEQIMRSHLNSFKYLKIITLRKGKRKPNVSAKFNSGLVAVDKEGRVKKKGELKKEKENEDPDR